MLFTFHDFLFLEHYNLATTCHNMTTWYHNVLNVLKKIIFSFKILNKKVELEALNAC